MKIIGGKSTFGRISIMSDEFMSTARSDEDGNITCRVKRHSSLSRFLYRNKNLPIPKLVRMILFFVDSMTKKGWMFLGLYVLIVTLTEKYLLSGSLFLVLADRYSPGLLNPKLVFLLWFLAICAVLIIPGVTYVQLYIASWHGAEHMAIAAYDRLGSTEMRDIVQESPINDECGGRLALPLLLGAVVAVIVAKTLMVSTVFAYILMLEGLLWVDALKGWDKIPGTSQASHLLQKWITTREPGAQELRTAQLALCELIVAHNSLS